MYNQDAQCASSTLCGQVHELPQGQCSDNQDATLLS